MIHRDAAGRIVVDKPNTSVSVPGAPAVPAHADSMPEPEWADREHQKTLAQESMQDVDPRVPQFTISTNKPMRCGDVSCSQPITLETPFLILSVPDKGAIFMHMLCMGINPSPEEMQDPNWISHVRRKFIDVFMHDKLYGRRTLD